MSDVHRVAGCQLRQPVCIRDPINDLAVAQRDLVRTVRYGMRTVIAIGAGVPQAELLIGTAAIERRRRNVVRVRADEIMSRRVSSKRTV